jgi:hypothetical protein
MTEPCHNDIITLVDETRKKLKQPKSLVQLEDGLGVEQDTDGMLWVVRVRRAEADAED